MTTHFALFNCVGDTAPQAHETETFLDFARALGEHDLREERDRALFAPVAFRAPHRCDENVVAVYALSLDFDHLSRAQLDVLIAHVEPHRLLIYSTWRNLTVRNGAGEPEWRVRVVLDLSRPVLDTEWAAFWSRAAGRFSRPGLAVDTKCANPSRAFYRPSAPTDADTATLIHEIHDGLPLDVDAVLADPEPHRPHRKAPASTRHAPRRTREAAASRLERLARELDQMPPDSGRNDRLNKIAYTLGGDVGAGRIKRDVVEARLLGASEANGLTADDGGESGVRATIASGLDAGIDTSDRTDEQPVEWLGEEWRSLGEKGPWLRETPPQRSWLLAREDGTPVLARGVVGLLVAPGGRGKTFALCGLALAIATGRHWLGAIHVVTPGRVVLGLAEEDEGEVRRRLHAAAADMGLSEHALAEAEAKIIPLGLAGRDVSLVSMDGLNVRASAMHVEIVRRVSQEEHAAVLLDPLARWASGIEGDNAAATRGIELLEEIARASGATVLAAHHTSKVSRREGPGDHGSSARGVTGLTDAARFVMELRGKREDDIELAIVKSNGAPLGKPIPLTRNPATGALRAMRHEEIEAAETAAVQRRGAVADERADEIKRGLRAALAARPDGVHGMAALRALAKGKGTLVQRAIAEMQDAGDIVGGRSIPYRLVPPSSATSTRGTTRE